MNEQVAGAS